MHYERSTFSLADWSRSVHQLPHFLNKLTANIHAIKLDMSAVIIVAAFKRQIVVQRHHVMVSKLLIFCRLKKWGPAPPPSNVRGAVRSKYQLAGDVHLGGSVSRPTGCYAYVGNHFTSMNPIIHQFPSEIVIRICGDGFCIYPKKYAQFDSW